MALAPLFGITVYDRTLRKLGEIGSYESCSVTARHMATGQADLVLSSSAPRVADLLQPGARLVITYDGEHLMSGPATPGQQGLAGRDVITFTVTDDFSLFGELLTPVDPTWTFDHPDEEGSIAVGSREHVLSKLLSLSTGWDAWPVPLRVGFAITPREDVSVRPADSVIWKGRVPFTDEVLPAIESFSSSRTVYADNPGWGVRVRQENNDAGQGIGLVVETYQGQLRTRTLTASSGVVRDLSWSRTAPTATRVDAVVRLEATDALPAEVRVYTEADAGLEAECGRVVQVSTDVTVDTSNGRPADADIEAQAREEARLALVGGRSISSISVTLAETETFRYARTFRVGDLVPVQTPVGTRAELVKEAVLSHARQDGMSITSTIGEDLTPLRVIGKSIQRLSARYRLRKVR